MSNEPNTSTDITADEGPSRGELYERCSELAQDPYILGRVDAEARKAGFAGPTDTLNLIYLAATTRLLEQPVSVAVHGPSSGGKSFTIAQSLKFLPPAAYKELTA